MLWNCDKANKLFSDVAHATFLFVNFKTFIEQFEQEMMDILESGDLETLEDFKRWQEIQIFTNALKDVKAHLDKEEPDAISLSNLLNLFSKKFENLIKEIKMANDEYYNFYSIELAWSMFESLAKLSKA